VSIKYISKWRSGSLRERATAGPRSQQGWRAEGTPEGATVPKMMWQGLSDGTRRSWGEGEEKQVHTQSDPGSLLAQSETSPPFLTGEKPLSPRGGIVDLRTYNEKEATK